MTYTVQCPSCATEFPVDPDKVPREGVNARCSSCAEVFFVGQANVGKSTLMRELTGHQFETGRKPGVTREPNFYDWASEDFLMTDLPGFGFMEGLPEERREAIKTNVVRYLEDHADDILVAVPPARPHRQHLAGSTTIADRMSRSSMTAPDPNRTSANQPLVNWFADVRATQPSGYRDPQPIIAGIGTA
jgi:predicted Zn finger-like uncharacterized protein